MTLSTEFLQELEQAQLGKTNWEEYHQPIMPREVVDLLEVKEGKVIVDATLGGGGHTKLFLSLGAHVIGFDQDAEARAWAKQRLSQYGDHLTVVTANFAHIDEKLNELGIDGVDAIFADIGVSSHHLDASYRGMSFQRDGALDMRMNQTGEEVSSAQSGKTAAELIAQTDVETLSYWFKTYGEEPMGWRMAQRIVEAREHTEFTTTLQLAEFIKDQMPAKRVAMSRKHPATKIFQALRMVVNAELDVLEQFLPKAVSCLKVGGLVGVMSFHSLEDRQVKHFFKKKSQKTLDQPNWPAPKPNPEYCLDVVTSKPVSAAPDEVADNPRSRSAKLRVARRVL